jgi:hypothetical protein
MIIGEPTKAVIRNGQLHVEGYLYEDSVMAKSVYETAKILKKSSKTRSFGFSIEGKALERDPLNPKRITKAEITGIAVTPSPKNPGTNLEIVKGGIDSFKYETEEGSEFLIDVTDENGIRTTVDKNFVIEKSEPASLQKAEGVQVGSTAEEMDGVTTKESVEGGKKKLDVLNKKKKKDEGKTEQDKKTFSKSETYEEIFSMFNCDVEDAQHLYKLIEGVQYVLTPGMEKVQISKEAISKAQELLGLATKVETAPDAEALKKAEDQNKIQVELDATLKKADELKALLGTPKVEQAASVAEVKVETASKVAEQVPSSDVIIKAFDSKFNALGLLIAAKDEQIEKIQGENADLKKGIEEITAFNQALAKKIGMIAAQPMDRKTITTTSFIEKGGNESQLGGGSVPQLKTLSLSNKAQRAELANVLYKAAEITARTENPDKELIKAVQTVELGSLGDTQQMSERLQQRLASEFKINVVR